MAEPDSRANLIDSQHHMVAYPQAVPKTQLLAKNCRLIENQGVFWTEASFASYCIQSAND
jgi:hypothetical protein